MGKEMSYEDLKREYDRAKIFVKAAHDLLQKQNDSFYVLDLLSETVFYDDADCDGYCLYEETGEWLDWQDELINGGGRQWLSFMKHHVNIISMRGTAKRVVTERIDPIVRSAVSMSLARVMSQNPIKRKRTNGNITKPKKWK